MLIVVHNLKSGATKKTAQRMLGLTAYMSIGRKRQHQLKIESGSSTKSQWAHPKPESNSTEAVRGFVLTRFKANQPLRSQGIRRPAFVYVCTNTNTAIYTLPVYVRWWLEGRGEQSTVLVHISPSKNEHDGFADTCAYWCMKPALFSKQRISTLLVVILSHLQRD